MDAPKWIRTSAASSATSMTSLRERIARDFEQNIPVRNNRFRLTVYKNTFVGREAVDYLIKAGYAKDRKEAVELGKELCNELNLFEHVCRDHEFKDGFLFYRFTSASERKQTIIKRPERHRSSNYIDGGESSSELTDHYEPGVEDLSVEELSAIAVELREKIPVKDRKHRLVKYSKCFVASEVVNFLVESKLVKGRSEAIRIGQRLQQELGCFHHVLHEHDFQDEYLFFQWKPVGSKRASTGASLLSPEGIYDVWFGPLTEAAHMNEKNWRDRMSLWRVGLFAACSENERFWKYQKEWCDAMVANPTLLDGWEATPYGALAKLIVLDQFPRNVYRGTPMAFFKDPIVIELIHLICENGWDEKEFNVVERMWVYIAASHQENASLQDLAVAKWGKWNTEVVSISSNENKEVNRKVGLNFLKLAMEYAEAVYAYGRFPHRNPIFGWPYKYSEYSFLVSPARPRWTLRQVVDPEYQALLAIFHRISPGSDCSTMSQEALSRFDEHFGLDGELLPILLANEKTSIHFGELYMYLKHSSHATALTEICSSQSMIETQQQVNQIIFHDETVAWPPNENDTPLVVDMHRLIAYIGCPNSLFPSKIFLSKSAIRDFQTQSGYQPESVAVLYRRHLKLISKRRSIDQKGRPLQEAIIDKDHFCALFGPLLSRNKKATLDHLYNLIDSGNNQVLDYFELFMALIVLGSGTAVDKAAITISFFDANNDGLLCQEELDHCFEACFLRCPAFLSSLFGKQDGSLYTENDSGEDVAPRPVQCLQTLKRAKELSNKVLKGVGTNEEGLAKAEDFEALVKGTSDLPEENRHLSETRSLFFQFFELNERLFLDEL